MTTTRPNYITLQRAERLTRDAALRDGLTIEILQSRWAGRLSTGQDGVKFRVAAVRVALHGRQRTKWVSMGQDGTARVS
jgi:hypothetical protein